MNVKTVKPFFRWAGGKKWLLKTLPSYLPNRIENYYEPFLGGGSIFFYLKSHGLITKKAHLSDVNDELINAYKVIKGNYTELVYCLKDHIDTEEFYYYMREQQPTNIIERAARFVFLNKTSFNGIYRVNSKGIYNVPYGRRYLKKLYDYEHLGQIHSLLDNVTLGVKDFKHSIKHASKGDFVFLDPPYTVAHNNNGFIHYNQHLFKWEDQMELASCCKVLDERLVNFLLLNAFHSSIDELYKFNKIGISRNSMVGGKNAKRGKYEEFLISNIASHGL